MLVVECSICAIEQGSTEFEICPIGIARLASWQVHFFAVLTIVLSPATFAQVWPLSIHFAAGFSGEGVFSSWYVSDDKEIEVSHSNWTFDKSSFGFILGLIFSDDFVCCCR